MVVSRILSVVVACVGWRRCCCPCHSGDGNVTVWKTFIVKRSMAVERCRKYRLHRGKTITKLPSIWNRAHRCANNGPVNVYGWMCARVVWNQIRNLRTQQRSRCYHHQSQSYETITIHMCAHSFVCVCVCLALSSIRQLNSRQCMKRRPEKNTIGRKRRGEKICVYRIRIEEKY